MSRQELLFDEVDWNQLIQNRTQWRNSVQTEMNYHYYYYYYYYSLLQCRRKRNPFSPIQRSIEVLRKSSEVYQHRQIVPVFACASLPPITFLIGLRNYT
jgi:hypothetical protein